jgi:hypothetical protein
VRHPVAATIKFAVKIFNVCQFFHFQFLPDVAVFASAAPHDAREQNR